MDELGDALRRVVRDVPDFPKPGIMFKDVTPLLADPTLFRRATDAMADVFRSDGITHVVAIESRGFILGAPVAQALGAAFVPVRKPGKLPRATVREEYALEYGTDSLELHADALNAKSRVLVVDDVLATGGTAAAACRLVRQGGAELAGCVFLMELTFLQGRSRLNDLRVSALLSY